MSTAMRTVELWNADYQPLGFISLQSAVRLLHLNKAVVEVADDAKEFLRDWLWPKVVRLTKQAKIAYEKMYGKAPLSKRGVLLRDNRKCAYCNGKADTIDHVIPKSRASLMPVGGFNTWLNLVACCFKCNNKKDNRTPQEARMKLLITPYVPTRAELRNKR